MSLILTGGGTITNVAGSNAITISTTDNSTALRHGLGTTSTNPAWRAIDIKRLNPAAPTGWYWLNLAGNIGQYWVDMEYDGGGWVLVATHPINVAIPGLTHAQTDNYQTNGSSGFVRGTSTPYGYATMVGLSAWESIVAQNGLQRTCVYFTASSQVALGSVSSHSRRSRWNWGGWGSSYAWLGYNNLINEVGGTTPGFWSYHISGNYNFITYENGGCGSSYANAPFWYGACWDGNFWGGNGGGQYANAAFWTGSGSDYYNYGAIYVR
jgi:hypothetical protein